MNEMQQAFERWAFECNYELRKMENWQYWCMHTDRTWRAFQAACRWVDGTEQVDRSVAIPEGRKTSEGYLSDK